MLPFVPTANRNNWHAQYVEKLTPGDRVADKVASFIGSWKFLMIQTGIFIVWVIINTLYLFEAIRFDPFPYILFNLFMSAEAAYSTPLIMMSQNRQTIRDRHQAEEDFQCNVMAKEEIEALQKDIGRIETEKLDKIIDLLTHAAESPEAEKIDKILEFLDSRAMRWAERSGR